MMLFTGTIHPDLGARDRRLPRDPVERVRDPAVREHRALLPGEGERARRRLLHRPDALRAGERSDHGAADHDRRDEAGVRQAHHRGHPVLRLLPAGPQGAVARADQREARRRHADRRRRRPDHLGRPPLRPDPGVLRRAVRPPDGAADPVATTWRTRSGLHGDDLVVVAPDAGRIKTAEVLRKYLHADLAFLYKRRSKTEAHKIEEMAVVGEVDGRPCVLVDDMIDTAGTVAKGAEALAGAGRRPDLRGARRTRSSPARPVSRSRSRRSRRSSSRTPCRSPRSGSSTSCRCCRSRR